MREWRNWQTRMIQVHVCNTHLQVQVLFPAPRKPLIYKGFRFFYARKYPNLTQTIPNHHMFSMKACILFADSRRMVSVT